MNAWGMLGIAPDSDRSAIRRGYARALRITNPEDDPDGFKALRAAYEHALGELEWREHHGATDEDDRVEEPAFMSAISGDDRWSAPVADPPPPIDLPRDPDSPDTLARDRERAALEALTGRLAEMLQGPWIPDDTGLAAQLAAIVAAPALDEIALRDAVEDWLADLLARTIPRSDAILVQAMAAFGWADATRFRNEALAALDARLDEWRLIEALNVPEHPQNAAWRTLTAPPLPGWRWRLAAARAGLARQVSVLLGRQGWVPPGLAHSFDAESVARWTAHFVKPRLTLNILIAVPIGLLLTWALVRLVPEAMVVTRSMFALAGAAFALLSPLAVLRIERLAIAWQARWLRPAAIDRGWLIPCLALPLAAIMLPPRNWSAYVVAIAVLATLGWLLIVRDRRVPLDSKALTNALVSGSLVLFFSFAPLSEMAAPAATIVAIALAVPLAIRFTLWPQLLASLEAFPARGRMLALAQLVCGLPSLGAGLYQFRLGLFGDGDRTDIFYATMLTLFVVMPVIGLIAAIGGRVALIVANILRLACVVAFILALAGSLPPAAAPAPRALSEVIEERGAAGDTKGVIEAIDSAAPGLARLETENPPEFEAIREIASQALYVPGKEVLAKIDAHLNRRFRALLPTVSDALLVKDAALRLDTLRDLRRRNQGQCLAPASGPPPDALRERAADHLLRVITYKLPPLASDAGGSPVSSTALIAEAARAANLNTETLAMRLGDKTKPVIACEAAIQLLEALSRHAPADIAATWRVRVSRD